jgi:hypothetical protein
MAKRTQTLLDTHFNGPGHTSERNLERHKFRTTGERRSGNEIGKRKAILPYAFILLVPQSHNDDVRLFA